MSDKDDPFGAKPPDNPFGAPPSTDPFGRPVGGDPFGPPPQSAPAGAPRPDAGAAPPPNAGDPWNTGPAAAPHNMPPPGMKADNAIPSLVLGIIGIILCPLCAPFAWYLGIQGERLVDASGGVLRGRGEATAGKILGIIGTVLMIIYVLLFIGLIVFGVSQVDNVHGVPTYDNDF